MSPEPQEENRDSGVGESPAVEKPAKPEPTPAEKYPVAQRILVPMANPATAEGLLRLANSLVGDDGKIIAAFVMVQNTEPRAGTLEKLEEIVEKLVEEGASIQLVTDMATSIARGILDLAQEQHADLIVLGIRGKRGSKIVLGQVVDSVARTSPCNVLVYRGMHSVYSGEGYRRVVVPVDGSTNSRVAARIGLRFASYTDAPMSALFVQTESSMRRWQALGHIEASLEDIEDIEHVRRLVVRSNDVVSGIVSRCSADDLIVLGFSEQSSLDSWLFGDIAQRMLAGAPGPLLLVKQAAGETMPERLEHRLSNLMPTLTPAEEAEVTHVAHEMAKPSTNYFVLVILSCLIASLGLLQNSVAVIIGAMLIAPLMSPLMGFAVGLTQGNLSMMRTALFTTMRGMLMALLLAIVVGLLTPFDTPTAEMLSRGQPSLPDMGVALFSGMAGAYAMARKDIPSALAGVAIAAALMPPLCTVGLAIAFGLSGLATGAFFLFVMNIVSISLAGAAVFLWLGVRLRADADDVARYRRRLLVSFVVLVVLAVPLVGSLRNSLISAREVEAVWDILQVELGGNVIDVQWRDSDLSDIIATVRLPEAPTVEDVARLQEQITARVGEPINLELVVLQSVRPPMP